MESQWYQSVALACCGIGLVVGAVRQKNLAKRVTALELQNFERKRHFRRMQGIEATPSADFWAPAKPRDYYI